MAGVVSATAILSLALWVTAAAAVATPSLHAGYAASTVKCKVCHSVHHSAVMGQQIRDQVGGDGKWLSETTPAEMLLDSAVAESCAYCHIETAAGGVRLYNGNASNWRELSAFSDGYAHNGVPCSTCHAVHDANTFKGAAAGKALKFTASVSGVNSNVSGNVANHTYHDSETGEDAVVGIQDEIFTSYSPKTSQLVAPGNLAQFTDLAGVIQGDADKTINSAVGADMKDLQVGAFCTTCHQTYASASEAVVNIDGDVDLYGPSPGHGHPVTDATADFQAAGSTLPPGQTVAWADADTCRKCHDAGTDDAPAGVVYSSFPHVTPGYYRFMGAGENAAEYKAHNVQQDMVDDATGWLAAGEQVYTTTAGDPNDAQGYMIYPGQNYKHDVPGDARASVGSDGLCLK